MSVCFETRIWRLKGLSVFLLRLSLCSEPEFDSLWFFYVCSSVLKLKFDLQKDFLCFFYVWLSNLSSSLTLCDSSTFVCLFWRLNLTFKRTFCFSSMFVFKNEVRLCGLKGLFVFLLCLSFCLKPEFDVKTDFLCFVSVFCLCPTFKSGKRNV